MMNKSKDERVKKNLYYLILDKVNVTNIII